jgi:rubrerythrin
VKAHDFFVAALPALKDAEVRALFEELRGEEIEHQELVKKELAKLPPDSGLSDEDFVDEPTAQ